MINGNKQNFLLFLGMDDLLYIHYLCHFHKDEKLPVMVGCSCVTVAVWQHFYDQCGVNYGGKKLQAKPQPYLILATTAQQNGMLQEFVDQKNLATLLYLIDNRSLAVAREFDFTTLNLYLFAETQSWVKDNEIMSKVRFGWGRNQCEAVETASKSPGVILDSHYSFGVRLQNNSSNPVVVHLPVNGLRIPFWNNDYHSPLPFVPNPSLQQSYLGNKIELAA